MPFLGGIGLSTIIAICFAIHVIRTGQDRYWLFILFIFPVLGCVVYFFAIFLPSLRQTRSGYQLESKLRQALDPSKELREAQHDFDLSPTVDSRLRLANALVNMGKADESLPHYQTILTGVYKDAPDILLQYAYALFAANKPDQVKSVLEHLRATNPNYRSDDGHLLYVRTLAQLDERSAAKEEFDALVSYHPSLEVYIRYTQVLIDWSEKEAAAQQLQALDERVKFLPKHAKKLNAQWISEAEKLRRPL